MAVLRSLKEKAFKPEEDNISSSDLGLGRLRLLLLTLGAETIGLDRFEEWLILPTLATFEAPVADNSELLILKVEAERGE